MNIRRREAAVTAVSPQHKTPPLSCRLARWIVHSAVIGALVASPACSAESQVAPGQRSPLTSIGAFTDLNAEADPDDPRGGSGFDAETYFQNVLASKLAECTRAVMVVFRTWVEQQKLAVSKIDERPGQLLAFVPVADRGGIFELSYRVDTKRERARTSLYFYSKDGSQHQPASLKAILQEYEIERLQDNLQKALLCGDN